MYSSQHFLSLITILGLFLRAVFLSSPPSRVVLTSYTLPRFRKTFTSISCFLRDQVQWEREHCYQLQATQKHKHFSWCFCCISYFGIDSCSGKNSKMPKVYLDKKENYPDYTFVQFLWLKQNKQRKVDEVTKSDPLSSRQDISKSLRFLLFDLIWDVQRNIANAKKCCQSKWLILFLTWKKP